MNKPNIERKAREVAEGWLGPEMFAPAMASGASWQPTEMKTFTIRPHKEVVRDLAGRIAAALHSAVAEEREECAKECIGYGHICNNKGCHAADATAIRARGQKAEETR